MIIFYQKKLKGALLVSALLSAVAYRADAQTNPTPQTVPYSQSFESFTGAETTYPVGIRGWQISSNVPSTSGRLNSPNGERALMPNGNASSSGTGVYDFKGKIGIVSNSNFNIGFVLAVNTTTVASTDRVRVNFEGSVIRNIYNGGTANVLASLILQYRIGETGLFTNVGNSAKNGTTVQSDASITEGIDKVSSSFLLPLACSNRPVLQLRWAQRTISGSAGNRPTFAVDDIVVTSETPVTPTVVPFTGYTISNKNITLSGNSTTYSTNTLSGVTRTQALSSYGGASTDFVGNASGYFKTYKDARDVWYLIDPAGYKFYSIGINTIIPQAGVDAVETIKSLYANTIGNFSDESITNMPYSVRLNFGYTYRLSSTLNTTLYDNGILPVFDAAFQVYCTTQANTLITAERIVDKNLLGYFSDNEVPLANSCCGPKLIDVWLNVNNYGGQGVADMNENYLAAVNWMKARHGGVLTATTTADKDEFPGFVADKYYKICRDAIKAKDPNHLYIGSRLHQDLSNRYQFEAAGKYVDVLSVNNYNVWSTTQLDNRYNVWEQYTTKPFMVTEFYAMADDSGLANSSGAGFNVKTQQDRADFFEHYTMEMLKRKWNVGFQYFKLNDDPASTSGGSNKGILNPVADNPKFWEPMRISYTKIAQDIYELRRFLIFDEQTLPISLKSFTAKADGEKVKIAWETLTETNNDRFEIQKSTDGVNYKTLYTVKGRGNSLQTANYLTYDDRPEMGPNYYKLMQFDLDGKYKEQGIRAVNFRLDKALTLALYPNPSKNEVNVIFNNFEGQSAKVTIYDLTGKMVHQEFFNTPKDTNSHRLNIKSSLKAGAYVLDFSGKGFSKREKLIVL